MSFILDALKKSESERQRQSGPALFEVKIAPPRSRFAVWGAAIGALLLVNIIVVGVVLWHGGASRAAAPTPVSTSSAAPVPTPSAVPAPVPQVQSSPMPVTAPQPARTDTRFGAPASTSVAPLASAAAPPAQGSSAPTPAPAPAPAGANAVDAGTNADDLAPAVEPRRDSSEPVTGVARATESGLPTYQDAAAAPGANIPSLSLDLHVYSPQADERFVFLNMLKLREGDTSPQGVRVERITPDGAILSYQGKEFVLQRH